MTAPLKVGAFPHDDGEVRVTLSTERGARVVDVRSFDPFAHVLMPNRSGLTLPIDKLTTLARILGSAVIEARAMGWIPNE